MPIMTAAPSSAQIGELTPIALPALRERPLVSVLMANYNYAAYVAQAIESVLHQTYSNWELLICDDGSTDTSLDVIEGFAKIEPRVRLISKANGGHASALNAAYALSKGEVICLLDSDDLYLPSKLERVVDCCQKNPDRGLIIHRVIRVDQRRRRRGVFPLLHSLPDGWYGRRMLEDGGVLGFLPPTAGLSLRCELAARLFPLTTFPPLHVCPDQVIMRLAPFITSIGSVDEALAEYRLHSSNTYGYSRATGASLSREIEFCEALWNHQHWFLSQNSPPAAARLKPANLHISFLQYLRAKLCNDPSARSLYRKYIAMLPAQPTTVSGLFWRSSFYLPRFLFERAINLFVGQNVVKKVIAWLKGFG